MPVPFEGDRHSGPAPERARRIVADALAGAEIHQAQGMVMVDLKLGLEEALLRMRAHAFTDGIALIDLARAIIAGQVLPAAAAGEA